MTVRMAALTRPSSRAGVMAWRALITFTLNSGTPKRITR
jgi:hypothetical protein